VELVKFKGGMNVTNGGFSERRTVQREKELKEEEEEEMGGNLVKGRKTLNP